MSAGAAMVTVATSAAVSTRSEAERDEEDAESMVINMDKKSLNRTAASFQAGTVMSVGAEERKARRPLQEDV